MKKSDELKQLRAEKVEALEVIGKKAEEEKRMLNNDEQAKFDELRSEIEKIDMNIKNAIFTEEQQRKKAANEADQRRADNEKETPEQKFAKRFSIVRAINQIKNSGKLTGAELEAYQETVSEYRSFSKSIEGQIGVPSFVVFPELKRDQNVTTPADGGLGVFTNFAGHIDPLRPRPVLEQAGAVVLRGLTGNLRFTKNSIVEAAWEGEVDENAAVTSTISVLDMSPNRLGATSTISKQLLVQSSPDIEAIVAREIASAMERAIDKAGINGAGSGNVPTGILNTSGVNDVANGTNGAVPTFAKVVEMETKVAEADGDIGTMTYILTPGLRGTLKTTEKASGTAQFIFNGGTNAMAGSAPVGEMNGYRALVSNQVPSGLTKGTSNDCHAMVFGDFSALYLGNWGGMDIVIDPYSAKKTAQVEYTVNSWWDVGIRHAAQFAHMKDAKLS